MKQHQTSSNPVDATSNALRKVRSLDCVRPTLSVKPHAFRYPTSSSSIVRPDLKASRFSVQAQKYKLPPTLECDEFQDPCKVPSSSIQAIDNNNNLGRSPFVSIRSPSSSAVSLVGLVDSTDQDYTLLCSIFDSMSNWRGHLRVSRLVNAFVFSLLILATLARYRKNDTFHSASSHKRFTSSSSSSSSSPDSGKNRGLLGSAMIESITEALSPILPFAGGLDLRRDEHWSFVKGWSHSLWMFTTHGPQKDSVSTENVYTSIENIASFPRGGGSSDIATRQRPVNILSVSEPFISRTHIAEMTLSDIALTLHYAVESGKPGFDSNSFLKQGDNGKAIRHEMKYILNSLDEAAAKSRGFLLQRGDSPNNDNLDLQRNHGDVDALQFCAAIRIFAEWRLLRQVPEGYKGYAVGMSLGHKDIVQNLAKIESSVHEWIELYAEAKDPIHLTTDINTQIDDDSSCCNMMSEQVSKSQVQTLKSPTLRDLLLHEIKSDLHPNKKLPQLKEKSAAMGLLWVRRQCQYQTSIFNNVLRIPSFFSSAVHAVSAAYSEVYGSLHGWAVQKIFNYSFQSAPDIHVIFRHMNPSLLNHLLSSNHNHQDIDLPHSTDEPIDGRLGDHDHTTESELLPSEGENIEQDGRKIEEPNIFHNLIHEWDNLGRQLSAEVSKIGDQIGKEWEKFSSSLFDLSKNKVSELNAYETRGGAVFTSSKASGLKLSGDALEEFITKRMSSDAQDRIRLFLNVAQPLLADLAGLFAELNMDDPTRV